MPENERTLLVVFEDRLNNMLKLFNDLKHRFEDLEASVKDKDETILQAERMIATLKTDYSNLLIARRLADDKDAFQQARKRVNKLVREVDLCIALLNE